MEKIQRAIILAAGEGSRLRPVTLTTPKPLVAVNGVRLINTGIEALKKNDIHEIYIVTGYKKELFYDLYKNDPEITILENPYYLKGNNITSLYVARDFLAGAFVMEGDLRIYNDAILDTSVEKSGYCASKSHKDSEWELEVVNNTIVSCDVTGAKGDYRLWGISMWTEADGKRLSDIIRTYVEDVKDWSIYWDELALFKYKSKFDLGIREINDNDITEIDTIEELIAIDPSYEELCNAR